MLKEYVATERDQFDYVIECTGAEPCVQMGIHLLRTRGTFVQVGIAMLCWKVEKLMNRLETGVLYPLCRFSP